MRIGLRYDMRAPDLGPGSVPAGALYEAAVEQCRWADERGFDTVYLAEHHGAEDNYCPSPVVLAAAIAGVTKNIDIHFSALCVTMHDPLRLAEDIAVLDLISGPGRIYITAGIGYRPHEFDMFGVDFENRAKVFEAKLADFRAALTANPSSTREKRSGSHPSRERPADLRSTSVAMPDLPPVVRPGWVSVIGLRPRNFTTTTHPNAPGWDASPLSPFPGTGRLSSTSLKTRSVHSNRLRRMSSMRATCTRNGRGSARTRR
ncbi:LLM class flavin-dependent oxidoreductase [Rhodococcus opacus]|nr:LLM class flavin-dependent oxidoreductase [Rhodococcus opacus]